MRNIITSFYLICTRDVVSILLILCTAGILVGCSQVSGKDEQRYRAAGVVEVSGMITFDGQPLANAQIVFTPGGEYGVTDANGKYQLRINSKRTGALPGEKVVRIWTTMRGDGYDELMGNNVYPTKETIPVEYNRASTLTRTVEPSKSQTFDFELKSGGKVDPTPAPDPED